MLYGIDGDTAIRTWERRYVNEHARQVVRLLDPAHTLAYLVDPLYCRLDKGVMKPTTVSDAQYSETKALIESVGGADACSQLLTLLAGGWKGEMLCDLAGECMNLSKDSLAAESDQIGSKRKRLSVAPLSMRKTVWEATMERFPNLSEVALRVLSIHPTSCASERKWELWGRVYMSSRTALGKQRAQKMITFASKPSPAG